MKILVESPKGRVFYDNADDALAAINEWLDRPAEQCRGITIGVHVEGDACDHETKGSGK